MYYCLECREEAVGPTCHRCGANTIKGAAPAYGGSGLAKVSAMCYALWALSAVAILAIPRYRRDRGVKFHAYQSILISGLIVVLFFSTVLYVPAAYRGTAIWAIQVAALTLWASMVALTWMGHDPSLPVVGDLAKKQL